MGLSGVISGRRTRPRRVLLYGTHGIGKSTWAASSPKPIFLQTEEGLDDIGVDRTPLLTTFGMAYKVLIDLYEDRDYQTVVIDTIDWLEKLIWARVVEKEDKGRGEIHSIEDLGYGKGYVKAQQGWEVILSACDALKSVGKNVILLAHAKVEKFSPPDGETYDRWSPDVHKLAAPTIQEWADEVFFAAKPVYTTKTKEGFKKERVRATAQGERVICTCEAATHAAKRRIEMPDQIPMVWSEYAKYWPTGQQVTAAANVDGGNIEGIVADGHHVREGQAA
jgi:hypothetical protein